MDLARARYITSTAGRAALATISPTLAGLEPTTLSRALRKHYPPFEAAALAEQLALHASARERFAGLAPPFLWTAPGLEMATHPLVAARRASRLATLAPRVIDLTCGLGIDLAAITATGTPTIGLDSHRQTAILAAANVPGALVLQADATHPPCELARAAVLIDPARREGGRRTASVDSYSPTWDESLALLRQAASGVLKARPGLPHDLIPEWTEAEFVQLGRSMREASLWAGHGAHPGLRRAVLLPANATLDSNAPECDASSVPSGAVLFDPESCVTRAGLVRHLAHDLAARLMDSQVAYLTAEGPAFHPMAATFGVLDSLPFSLSRLRELLRTRHWRPDEIRRRAFPIEPDELRRLLGRLEGEPVTLLLTTLGGRRMVFVARRLQHPPG